MRDRRVRQAVLVVTLRDVHEDDLALLFSYQQEPEATAMADFPTRERAAFDVHWAKILADPTGLVRAIVDADIVVGNIVSWNAEAGREVGYWLGRAHWGRGLASAALGLFLEIEPIRPLHANVAPHNEGSLKVLAKHGFQVIATGGGGVDLRLD